MEQERLAQLNERKVISEQPSPPEEAPGRGGGPGRAVGGERARTVPPAWLVLPHSGPRSHSWPGGPCHGRVSVAAIPGLNVCTEGLGFKGQLEACSWPTGLRERPRPSLAPGATVTLPSTAGDWRPQAAATWGWGSGTPRQRHLAQLVRGHRTSSALGTGHTGRLRTVRIAVTEHPGLTGLRGTCPGAWPFRDPGLGKCGLGRGHEEPRQEQRAGVPSSVTRGSSSSSCSRWISLRREGNQTGCGTGAVTVQGAVSQVLVLSWGEHILP